MPEPTHDAYQRRRRLLLEVSRVLYPARRSADVEVFVVIVEGLPAGAAMDGPAREPRTPSDLLAASTRALELAEPLLRRATVGEFDQALRGRSVTDLIDLHASVTKALTE